MSYSKVRRALALMLTVAALAIATTASAQVSFRLSFGTTPRWETVPGTRVYVVDDADRPDYDVFRYNNSYYVYRNSQWYSSNDWRGDFRVIDETQVPVDFQSVPQNYWRSYPSRWQGQGRDYRDQRDYRDHYNNGGNYYHDRDATFRVTFNSRPRWESVHGTRVRVIRTSDRPDYDMFSYGGRYYIYNNGTWYSSRNWRGSFYSVDRGSVPRELRRVPRQHWRDYPWNDDDNRYRR